VVNLSIWIWEHHSLTNGQALTGSATCDNAASYLAAANTGIAVAIIIIVVGIASTISIIMTLELAFVIGD
jgi:hypothetical protein